MQRAVDCRATTRLIYKLLERTFIGDGGLLEASRWWRKPWVKRELRAVLQYRPRQAFAGCSQSTSGKHAAATARFRLAFAAKTVVFEGDLDYLAVANKDDCQRGGHRGYIRSAGIGCDRYRPTGKTTDRSQATKLGHPAAHPEAQ